MSVHLARHYVEILGRMDLRQDQGSHAIRLQLVVKESDSS